MSDEQVAATAVEDSDVTPEMETVDAADHEQQGGMPKEEVTKLIKREVARAKRQERAKLQSENNNSIDMEAIAELVSTTVSQRLTEHAQALERKEKDAQFSTLIADRQIDDEDRDIVRAVFEAKGPQAAQRALEKMTTQTTDPNAPPSQVANVPAGIASAYQSPGAPASPPPDVAPNPINWTKEDVQRLREEGRFLDLVDKWADALPGGTPTFGSRRSRRLQERLKNG